MKCVQYIVIRRDLVPIMGVGKTAAQAAHASLGVVLDHGKLLDTPEVRSWTSNFFGKIVVYVKTKQKLLNLANKLDELKIRNKLIYDACLTKLEPEEENGSTLTCMGVEPIAVENVPKCLRSLQLLDGEE